MEVRFNAALKWTKVPWEREGAAYGPRTRHEAGRHALPPGVHWDVPSREASGAGSDMERQTH